MTEETTPPPDPAPTDDRSVAMLAHLLALSGYVIPFGIIDLVLIIIAAVSANGGQRYRYPFTLRLVK